LVRLKLSLSFLFVIEWILQNYHFRLEIRFKRLIIFPPFSNRILTWHERALLLCSNNCFCLDFFDFAYVLFYSFKVKDLLTFNRVKGNYSQSLRLSNLFLFHNRHLILQLLKTWVLIFVNSFNMLNRFKLTFVLNHWFRN